MGYSFTQKIAVAGQLASLLVQIYHFKKTRSVYGYSFNFLLMNFIEKVTFFSSSSLYLKQLLVKQQYIKRFPIYPQIQLSRYIHVITFLEAFFIVFLGYQCVKYGKSRHSFQSVSKGLLISITVLSIFSSIVLYCSLYNLPSNIGKFGIFYIDFVDLLWVWGTIAGSLKTCSQILLNWTGMCVRGVSHTSLAIDLVVMSVICGIKVLYFNDDFHFVPVNDRPLFMYMVQVALVVVLNYQVWLYKGSKPFLKTVLQEKSIV